MNDIIMEEMLLDDWKEFPQDEFALYLFEILDDSVWKSLENNLINDSAQD